MITDSYRSRIVERQRRRQRRMRAAMRAEAVRLAGLATERFSFRRLYLYGSVATGSPLSVWSDIDLAVEGLPPDDYFKLLGTLSAEAGYPLDIKPWEELPPATREHVIATGAVLHDAG